MRAIATDLDGTLFDHHSRVSPRAVDAIGVARAAGIEVIAATGRSRFTAVERLAEVAEHLHVVCSNGSCVVDPRSGDIVMSWPISSGEISRVVDAAATAVGGLVWAWEGPQSLGRNPLFPVAGLDGLGAVDPIDALPSELDIAWAPKLMVAHPEHDPETLWRLLVPHVAAEVSVTISGGPFVELTAKGVSKARGVAWVCDSMGIAAHEVVALGDHANDVELLRWAGVGLAMAGSHAEAVAVADRVIGAHELDGWAIEVERLVAATAAVKTVD